MTNMERNVLVLEDRMPDVFTFEQASDTLAPRYDKQNWLRLATEVALMKSGRFIRGRHLGEFQRVVE